MRARRLIGERGDSGATQVVMLAGVLVLFLFGVFWVGRFIIAEGALDEVARNAARAASLGPDAATGHAAAYTAAEETLAAQGLNCVGVDLDVDTSGFAAPIGQPAQVAVTYATLRAILNTAVDDDAIHRNPCRITGAGQPSSPERPLLDLETVEALAAAMPTHLQTLCLVTFWAHLRIGEVVALQRRDVDILRGKIRIERQHVELRTGPLETEPKAASRRTVHLPAQALEVLSAHLADRPGLPTAPVFTRADGSLLRASHVQNAWTTARKRVGVDHAHFHDLRHAGLTLTAQLGATTAEVMRRAGHSSARAANIYQHAAEGRDIAIAKLLSAVEGTGQPADWKHNAGS